MRTLIKAAAQLRATVGSPEILRLQLAWSAVVAAEVGHMVALGVFAYERGGTSAVGIAGLVRLVPAAVLAPFASTLADRFRREHFLLAVTGLGTVALAASAVTAWQGSESATYALAGVVGISSTLFRPGFQALLPSLARTTDELVGANAIGSTLEGVGALAGPVVSGAIVAGVSVQAAFVVWAGTMALAAVLVATVRVSGVEPVVGAPSLRAVVADVRAGAAVAAASRETRTVLLLILVQTFVRGCLTVLVIVVAYRLLDRGAGAVGLLTAAIGLGGIIGALWSMGLGTRRLARLFSLSLVLWGAPIALIAVHDALWLSLLLLTLVGVANSVEDVTAFTLIQRTMPDGMLARILGLEWGVAMGFSAIGSAVAPFVVRALDPRPALVVVGVLLPLASLLTFRVVGRLDAGGRDDLLDRVDRVPLLAPLSVAAKERIGRRLVTLEAAPGEVVIREGEVGDRYYVLEEGQMAVDAGGTRRTISAPDAFGEIALLRDVPRTATVTALTPCSLLALDRDVFLAAVTGHDGARAAGAAIVEQRLAADMPA